MNRHVRGLLAALALGAGAAGAAAAADTVPLPEKFLIATAPAGAIPVSAPAGAIPAAAPAATLETPQQITGVHTVIAPLFLGDDGNYSFIRIANLNATSVDTTATLVGSPTGRVYASGTLTSPLRSSPQWSLAQVYAALNVSYGLLAGDTAVALYLSNGAHPLTGFQHVIYNGTNGFFENASVCTFTANGNYANFGARAVSNVHTSRIPAYPSTVYLHNRSSNTVVFNLTVSDSRTGTLLGTLSYSASGNATYAIPEAYFETQLAFHPTAAQQHISVIVNNADPLVPDIVLSHFIVNQTYNAYVNMSAFCSIDY